MLLSTGESESIGSIGGYTCRRPARQRRYGRRLPGTFRLGTAGRGQGRTRAVRTGRGVPRPLPAGDLGGPPGERSVHRSRGGTPIPHAEVPWMATLYVPSRTLSEIVARQGPLSGHALRTLALGLVEALRDIHQAGAVHRDLKPSNVLLAQDGPRVIDFGISRAADNQALTRRGGSSAPRPSCPRSSSPRPGRHRRLGRVLAGLAAGVRGHRQPSLRRRQPVHDGHPGGARAAGPGRRTGAPQGIAERLLDKDATARPDLTELHRLFRDLPDVATAPARPGRVGPLDRRGGRGAARRDGGDDLDRLRPARRRRVRLLVALGAALAVTAVSASVYSYRRRAPRAPRAAPGGRTTASHAAASPPRRSLPAGNPGARTSPRPRTRRTRTSPSAARNPAAWPTAPPCTARGPASRSPSSARRLRPRRVAGRPHPADHPAARRPGTGVVYTYEKPGLNVRETWRLGRPLRRHRKRLWYRLINEVWPAVLFDGGVLAKSDDGEDGTEFVAFDARTGKEPASTGEVVGDQLLLPAGPGRRTLRPVHAAELRHGPRPAWCASTRPTARRTTSPRCPTGWCRSAPRARSRCSRCHGTRRRTSPSTTRTHRTRACCRAGPTSGALVRIPLAGPPRGSATLLDGVVYFVRPDGTVTAVRVTDGARLWQRETQIENLSKPALSTTYDDLFFANRYGRLLALDRATGAARWHTDKLDNPGNSPETTVPEPAGEGRDCGRGGDNMGLLRTSGPPQGHSEAGPRPPTDATHYVTSRRVVSRSAEAHVPELPEPLDPLREMVLAGVARGLGVLVQQVRLDFAAECLVEDDEVVPRAARRTFGGSSDSAATRVPMPMSLWSSQSRSRAGSTPSGCRTMNRRRTFTPRCAMASACAGR